MWRKALLPLLLILAAVLLLAAAAYWYEQRFGTEGSFPATGHEGHGH